MTGSAPVPGPGGQRQQFAARLEEAGVPSRRFIDVRDGEKGTRTKGHQEPINWLDADDETLSGNYGVHPGYGLIEFDVDDYDGEHDTDALDVLPETFTVASPHTADDAPGHRYYAVEDDDAVKAVLRDIAGTLNPEPSWGEVKYKGKYVVGPGSQLTGCTKEWCDRCAELDGGHYRIAEDTPIATITADDIGEVLRADPEFTEQKRASDVFDLPSEDVVERDATPNDGDEWITERLAGEALEHVDPDLPRSEWIGVGFALVNHFGSSTGGSLFKQWSRSGRKWNPDDAERVIDDAGNYHHDIRHFVNVAKSHGWDASAAARSANAERTEADGGTTTATSATADAPDGGGGDPGTYATVAAEPVVDEHERVSIVQATDDGRDIVTTPLGLLQCWTCGTVVGSHVKVGESIDPPNSCPACEKQAGFEPVGADGEPDPDLPLSTYLDPPWDTPSSVETDRADELWDDVCDYIRDHWDAGEGHEHLYDGLTAYAITTWLRPDLEFLPHLMLMGRFTGGKTRLLTTLSRVSYRTIVAASATPASMFRLIDNFDVTFFVSEYHGLDPDTRRDLDAIIRAAQKRDEKVTRADPTPQGRGGFNPTVFDPFTHVAVATQYEPDDDIISRCVQVRTSPAGRDMPATHDEERGRDIRNRMLYARLRYLESDEFEDAETSAYGYLAKRGIDGRPREKLLALLTVANLWDRTEEIEPFVDELVRTTAEAEADSADAHFVEAVRDLAFEEIGRSVHDGDGDPFGDVEISMGEIAERYNTMTGEDRSTSWIGHVRSRLSLEKKRKRDGTVIADPQLRPKLEQLCEDYGLAWESLDYHDPVTMLPEDKQLRSTCSECGELRWLAHKHAGEGYHICGKCADDIRDGQ